jgi:subtilisin family serine protease
MKKFFICLLLIVSFSYPALANVAYISKYSEPKFVEGEVLVVLEDAPVASDYSIMGVFNRNAYSQAVSNQAEAFTRARGLEARNTYPDIARVSGKNIIHIRSINKSTEQLIKELSTALDVENVQPNHIVELSRIPIDTYYPLLWGMPNIGMPQVWDYVTGSSSIYVAVLDTGIDYSHIDISANIGRDSSGYVGRTFNYNGTVNYNPVDIDNHGTHVAGIIGAVGNNGMGVVGVNWTVKMLAVNVFTPGIGSLGRPGAYDSDIVAGINYVVSEKTMGTNIRVTNMSFGGWDNPLNLGNSALAYALLSLNDVGVIYTVSAGNDGLDLNSSGTPIGIPAGWKPYPACLKFPNNITVGSINSNNAKSSFSNYGCNFVDIAAPGGDIVNGYAVDSIYSTIINSYGYMVGTSMSAPHVAGATALLCAAYPSESHSQIRARILNAAKNINTTTYWGRGTLDVWSAYQLPSPIVIDTTFTHGGIVGVPYSLTFNASGNYPRTWTIISGSLPSGLSLNSTTGVISGIPTWAGMFYFTIKVVNATGSDTRVFSIYVNAGAAAPTIITSSLADGYIFSTYNDVVSATGLTPITWSIDSGELPSCFSMSTDGEITGFTSESGSYYFTVRATNSAGSDTKALSIEIWTK